MKIIVPTVGAIPDQKSVDYIINIAKRFKAQLIVLRVLSEKETKQAGEQSLSLFIENGDAEKVPVNWILRRGDIAPAIIEVAEDNSADLIVLGISHGEIVAEWMNAKAIEKTDIPVLLIPKWVSVMKRQPLNR
jgi:nucleotide-binding universal stress UspA family protein